jgi:hypothetical protein
MALRPTEFDRNVMRLTLSAIPARNAATKEAYAPGMPALRKPIERYYARAFREQSIDAQAYGVPRGR